EHKIHSEKFSVDGKNAAIINETKSKGGRIIAVGTTSVRVLESAANNKQIVPSEGETGIFILPGYEFKIVDAMITNFHLPRSTLLALVAAFAGLENILSAYSHAVENRYRFYSYGDAMLIL
ncbi:MAG: S-adenosylmethionine:tRNA ribosyltransferase-isomerase, partial [Phycisphaerae bacterium]